MQISNVFLATDRVPVKAKTSDMQGASIAGLSLKAAVLGLAALGVTAISAPAWAGCGDGILKQPAAWQRDANGARATPVVYGAATIVGLWSVQFTAANQIVDFGYQQWHADGTEILNSGAHHPATQNFCLGVWQQTAAYSYRLNHWALSYSPTAPPPNTPATPAVKVNIKEEVTLNPQGNTFSGTFSIIPYDFTTGVAIPGAAVSGQVRGQRITPY
ncbi:MAG TPA: hypothetical protein VGH03_13155 [Caulobacteraceae bacterium]